MRPHLASLGVVLVAVFASPAIGDVGPVHHLTLIEAFERGLAANPRVEGARVGIDVSEAQKKISFSYLLPRVAVTGDYTLNDDEVTFGGGDEQVTILPEQDWSYRLVFRQPLYAGFRDLRTYQQAKFNIESAEETLRDAENLILLQVGIDYLGVLQGEALVEVEERNAELAQNRLKQSTDFFEVGEVTRVDVLRSEASIMAAQRRFAEARQQRETAAGRLLVDLALGGSLEVERPEEFLPPVDDEETMVQRALAVSPLIQEAEYRLMIAELEVKKQRGAYLPIVFADGGWTKQKSGFPSDEFAFVALNLSVPLFQGGEVRARVDEAENRQRQAELHLDDLKRKVKERTRTALFELETAETVLALAHEELEVSELEYEELNQLYQAQEATSLDLEASALSLAVAQRTVVTSEVDLRVAALRVYYVVGTLQSAVLGNKTEKGNS